MILWQTIAVAFAMFSAVPVPQPVWNEKNMKYALCAFPLVGLVCALAWWAWATLAQVWAMPSLLRAAGLCIIPILVTGGIHLDGYADTCDAMASCSSRERKQEILKDPHCGAFALIRVCVYFIAYLGLSSAVIYSFSSVICIGLGFLLERSLSGLAVAWFPLAKNTGLAHTFATAADQRTVRRFLLFFSVFLAAGIILAGGLYGVAMVLAAGLVFGRYYQMALAQFGGISGDLAGWFLQKAEIWMLGAFVICQMLEEKVL